MKGFLIDRLVQFSKNQPGKLFRKCYIGWFANMAWPFSIQYIFTYCLQTPCKKWYWICFVWLFCIRKIIINATHCFRLNGSGVYLGTYMREITYLCSWQERTQTILGPWIALAQRIFPILPEYCILPFSPTLAWYLLRQWWCLHICDTKQQPNLHSRI